MFYYQEISCKYKEREERLRLLPLDKYNYIIRDKMMVIFVCL